MKRIQVIAVLLLLITSAFSGDKVTTPKATPQVKPTLMFFINPNGSPCQQQDQIIQQAKADIEKFVQIRYVKTTIPADRETFYQYGIRSLPNLILVDEKGKELRRFAPGIQTIETIMNGITGK